MPPLAFLQGGEESITVSICTNYWVLAVLPVSCEGQTKAPSTNTQSRRSLPAGESSGRGMSLGHFYSDMFDVLEALTTIENLSASNINKLNDFVQLSLSGAQRKKLTGFAPDFSDSSLKLL